MLLKALPIASLVCAFSLATPALAQSCYMELDNGQIINLESLCGSQGNPPTPSTAPPISTTPPPSTTVPTPDCAARLADRAEPINPPVPLPIAWRDPNVEDVLPQQLEPTKPYPTPGDRFILFLSERESSYWAWDGKSWYLWGYVNESSNPFSEGVFLMQNLCTGVLSF